MELIFDLMVRGLALVAPERAGVPVS